MKDMIIAGLSAAVRPRNNNDCRGGQQGAPRLRRQRCLGFSKIAEASVKKAQGELSELRPAVQISRTGGRCCSAARHRRSRRGSASAIMVSAVDTQNQTEGLNRVAEQAFLFTADRMRRSPSRSPISAPPTPSSQGLRQADAEGAARWRRIHRVRRPAGRRQRPRAHRGREGSAEGVGRSSSSMFAATRSTRPVPSATSRTRSPRPGRLLPGQFLLLRHARVYEVLKRPASSVRSRSLASTRIRSRSAGSGGDHRRHSRPAALRMGYQGMKLWPRHLEGDKSGIPADRIIIVPSKVVDQSNVDDFIGGMEQVIGG